MPATAGRVPMPKGNRVDTGSALRTNSMWSSVIGHAGAGDAAAPSAGPSKYDEFKGLLAMARHTTGGTAEEARGTCRKCGRMGHLTFQCRNKMDGGEPEAGVAAAAAGGAESDDSFDSAALRTSASDTDDSDAGRRDRKRQRKEKKAEKKAKEKRDKKEKKERKREKKERKDKDREGEKEGGRRNEDRRDGERGGETKRERHS